MLISKQVRIRVKKNSTVAIYNEKTIYINNYNCWLFLYSSEKKLVFFFYFLKIWVSIKKIFNVRLNRTLSLSTLNNSRVQLFS